MLQFNPSKRITMTELLEHSMLKPFRKSEEETTFTGPVTTILDDNIKQSVEKYRMMVYGKKQSLMRSNNSYQYLSSKELKKNNSEKHIGKNLIQPSNKEK